VNGIQAAGSLPGIMGFFRPATLATGDQNGTAADRLGAILEAAEALTALCDERCFVRLTADLLGSISRRLGGQRMLIIIPAVRSGLSRISVRRPSRPLRTMGTSSSTRWSAGGWSYSGRRAVHLPRVYRASRITRHDRAG
jgi:hypothetical protein